MLQIWSYLELYIQVLPVIPHKRNANHAVYIDQPFEMSLALDKNGGKSLVSNSISVRRSNMRTTAKDVYKPTCRK